jgi:hypothetical protein
MRGGGYRLQSIRRRGRAVVPVRQLAELAVEPRRMAPEPPPQAAGLSPVIVGTGGASGRGRYGHRVRNVPPGCGRGCAETAAATGRGVGSYGGHRLCGFCGRRAPEKPTTIVRPRRTQTTCFRLVRGRRRHEEEVV